MKTIISIFDIEVTRPRIMRKLPFLVEIVELFQRNQLVAEYDVSVKNSVIGVV